jgi:large subunit ribosomal protein L34e
MPKPMHRSGSFKRMSRVTPTGRTVVHYRRAKSAMPHCAICGSELGGMSARKGGKSRRTTSRLFGGVLCAGCAADVIKLGSRIEQGDMKLDDIGMKQRTFVLQLVAH